MGRRNQPELKSGKIERHEHARRETILSFIVITLLFGGAAAFFIVLLAQLVHSLATDPSADWFGLIPMSVCATGISGFLAYFYIDLIRGYYHRTFLLSDRTLAIVHPRRPTIFVKARHLQGYRPDKCRLILRSGKPLPLWPPVASVENRKITLAILRRWYGEETIDAARAALQYANTLPRKVSGPVMAIVAVVLLAAVCFGALEMWLWLKASLAALGIVISGIVVWLSYAANRVMYPLTDEAGRAHALSPPKDSPIATAEIQRIPESPPDALNHTWHYLFIPLALTGLIPVFDVLLSTTATEWNPWPFVVFGVFDAALVIGYCLYRLYILLIRGDLFITLLLSSRTLAIGRPKQPVAYVKPAACAAFTPANNTLELRDGSRYRLEPTGLAASIPDAFKVLRSHWWPDMADAEHVAKPNLTWKHIAVATLVFGLGILLMIIEDYFKTFWFAAVGGHLLFAAIIYMLYQTVCVTSVSRIQLPPSESHHRA